MKFFRKKNKIEKSKNYKPLEKEHREKTPWLFNSPPEIVIEKDRPPILIYQMGKVGSTSINASLKNSGIPNPVYHIHQLRYDGIEMKIKENKKLMLINSTNNNLTDRQKVYNHLYIKFIIRQLENYKLLREKVDKNFNKIPWKIITLVRDPVMRQISDFFFSFHKHPELMNKEGDILREKTLEVLKNEITELLTPPKDYVLKWFDKEFKAVLGIDVYDFPFDREEGYTIINYNNISILIIKLEKLNQCFNSAISKFIEKDNLKLLDRNQAKQKFYYDTYKYVMNNITFDYDFCKAIYSSKFMKHFYSPREIESFLTKWTGSK
ncbi:MAG: hypothetical protein KAW12_05915 [Candidatus Aminicenantes bacterium]|nr:hypothetical protein [Candidatus Aminicenantes bacterium]